MRALSRRRFEPDPVRRTRHITSAEFVRRLGEAALAHRATRHPYLTALAEGSLGDPRLTLQDFARAYRTYSVAFGSYLRAVIDRLDEPAHRRALLDNLAEESGRYDDEDLEVLAEHGASPEWFVGVPHPLLFERFARAVGVEGTDAPLAEAVRWRDAFLRVLESPSAAVGVGALGLGTEHIVSTIYQPLVQATQQAGVSPPDAVFFVLHTCVDDAHKESLAAIATDLAETPAGRAELRLGMISALELRALFWDQLLVRAQAIGAPAGGNHHE